MVSNPNWGERTSALEVAASYADRIKGRNIVVTGVGPQGVGEGTAIALASQKPANLVLMARTKERVETTAKEIQMAYPGINIHIVLMDMASQDSIRKAADEVKQLISSIDILVNNAGCTFSLRRYTVEGIEMQFGVNHIGTFLLTKLLYPLLRAAAKVSPPGQTRIVNVSSHAHNLSPIRFHDYNMENKELPMEERHTVPIPPAFVKPSADGYLSIIAYAQSKTANVLFTKYFHDRAGHTGIMSYALNPGGVISNLGRNKEGQDEEIAKTIIATAPYWKNSDEGGSTSVVAALDPALDSSTEFYLADCQFHPCAKHAKDPDVCERLWALSEELTGGKFVVD